MFKKLQDKWKVSGVDFILVFLTFAAGGSLCGLAGKKIMALTGMDKSAAWLIVYILILTVIWPLCVLLISIPFGQFTFFKRYLTRMWQRISGSSPKDIPVDRISKTNIALFASGAGTNAAKIISHFKASSTINVALVVSNKTGAGVVQIAEAAGIPVLFMERDRFYNGDAYLPELRSYNIQWIILAGFLWKVPGALIKAFPRRIINIHPALLPKYGGKGMYGEHVHQAVIEAGDTESGITIHYVDEIYDNGEVIRQSRCEVSPADTAQTLAAKIHLLEHEHFPQVIEQVILETHS